MITTGIAIWCASPDYFSVQRRRQAEDSRSGYPVWPLFSPGYRCKRKLACLTMPARACQAPEECQQAPVSLPTLQRCNCETLHRVDQLLDPVVAQSYFTPRWLFRVVLNTAVLPAGFTSAVAEWRTHEPLIDGVTGNQGLSQRHTAAGPSVVSEPQNFSLRSTGGRSVPSMVGTQTPTSASPWLKVRGVRGFAA